MTTFPPPREGEIDLLGVVRVLIHRWRFICISMVSCTAVGFVAALLLPKQYQALSIVLLAGSEVLAQFDSRVETSFEPPPSSTLQALSLSDRVLDELVRSDAATGPRQGEHEVSTFQDRLSATAADTVLRLTVEGTDPDRVAAVANAWAGITVRVLNDIYGPRAGTTESYMASAERALVDWEAAQEALASFQTHSPERVLGTRLGSLGRELAT